jgi:hypothetical protein
VRGWRSLLQGRKTNRVDRAQDVFVCVQSTCGMKFESRHDRLCRMSLSVSRRHKQATQSQNIQDNTAKGSHFLSLDQFFDEAHKDAHDVVCRRHLRSRSYFKDSSTDAQTFARVSFLKEDEVSCFSFLFSSTQHLLRYRCQRPCVPHEDYAARFAAASAALA